MPIDISKFTGKLRSLEQRKIDMIHEHDRKLAEINDEIKQEKSALAKINEVLEPYVCRGCDGSGQESFTDAAGSRDWRKCRCCNGTGINT